MRWALYDELVAAATQDAADVLAARAEWSAVTGEVHADHELYGERSDAFVEWYVLERRGRDGCTAVERALLQAALSGNGPDLDAQTELRALRGAYRSLFQVRALPPGGLLLDDLLGGGQFAVEERRRLPGVSPGDLFEARLLPELSNPPQLLLGRALLFHPREALPAVLEQVRAARRRGQPREALLGRLLRLRLRSLAYRHVSPARIYAQPE